MRIAVIFACALFVATSADPVPSKLVEDVARGTSEMGFNAYKILANTSGNILFSPISAEFLLAMAYVGSSGNTSVEMAKALALPADFNAVADGFERYTKQLLAISDFNMANRIYAKESLAVDAEYKSTVQTKFGSGIESVNFADAPAAANIINSWVANETHGKIKEAVQADSLSATTSMVLVNAVYFLGVWKYKFEPVLFPMEFFITPENRKPVIQMALDGHFPYKYDVDMDADILELPYTNGFSMVLIIPHTVHGLARVEEKMPIDLNQEFSDMKIFLRLPKFTTESKIDVKSIFEKMGMVSAFTPDADFSKMSKEHLEIDQIHQKTLIQVSEQGTEAAAETDMEIDFRFGSDDEPTYKLIKVDRPFMYVIHKKAETGPVFIGRYAGPETK